MKIVIDGQEIRMNEFVHSLVFNLLKAVLESLKDIPDGSGEVIFTLTSQGPVKLSVAGEPVRMNSFVRKTVGNILQGILASLDDLPAELERISFHLSSDV